MAANDETPNLPTAEEIELLRELLQTKAPPRDTWRVLMSRLLEAYVWARGESKAVLASCDAAILGLTTSADRTITELASKLADAEAQSRQAASNAADLQLEVHRLRTEVESLRPHKTITNENPMVCRVCGGPQHEF